MMEMNDYLIVFYKRYVPYKNKPKSKWTKADFIDVIYRYEFCFALRDPLLFKVVYDRVGPNGFGIYVMTKKELSHYLGVLESVGHEWSESPCAFDKKYGGDLYDPTISALFRW